jgi:hypothetical protein
VKGSEKPSTGQPAGGFSFAHGQMLNIVRGYIIHYLGLFWGRKHAEKRLFSPSHNVNRRNRRYGLKTRHKHTLFACIVLLHVVKYMFYNVKALC